MKIFKIALLTIVSVGLIQLFACKKYDGDSYDFSRDTGNYISFVSTTKSVTLNSKVNSSNLYLKDTVKVNLVTRLNFQYPISYRLSYIVSGGSTVSATGIYRKDTIAYPSSLFTTDDMFPSGLTKITGKIVLEEATGESGNSFVVGYPTRSTGDTISFTAYKPGSAK